jgi:hypothetical protein
MVTPLCKDIAKWEAIVCAQEEPDKSNRKN